MKIKAGPFLAALNVILVATAWGLALYAYPRIPAAMAAPLSVLGVRLGTSAKSALFFLDPAVQALLTAAVLALGRRAARRGPDARLGDLRREHLYLGLIFVNVILIHLERNVISLAVTGRSSINAVYLAAMAAVIVLVYLYYRLRRQSLRL